MKTFILTVAATALLFTPSFSIAEEPAGGKPPGGGPDGDGKRGPRMNPEERIKMMTEKLGLTPEQQEKIKAIFEKGQAEREARKASGEKPTEEERAKFREAMKAQRDEIDAVLTPEQRTKVQEMRKNREKGPGGPGGERGERGERKHKKDGEPAPAQ